MLLPMNASWLTGSSSNRLAKHVPSGVSCVTNWAGEGLFLWLGATTNSTKRYEDRNLEKIPTLDARS